MWSINEPKLDGLPYSIWLYKSCNKIEKQLFRSVTNRVLQISVILQGLWVLENFVIIKIYAPTASMSARLAKIMRNQYSILSLPCVGRYTGGWVFTYGYMPGKRTCLTLMGDGLPSTGMCLRVCVLSKFW